MPIEEKAHLLLKTNEEALRVKGVRFVTSSLTSIKESRLLATTDGSLIQQTFMRMSPNVNVTAVCRGQQRLSDTRCRRRPSGPRLGVRRRSDLAENVARWAEEAAAKLTAAPVEPGMWDLVLHPSHLWLTIHESIGHPTELDRAIGYEANYAGTSFLAPPEKVLRQVPARPGVHDRAGNRTEPGGCATCGWDDEGVAATSWPDRRQRHLRELSERHARHGALDRESPRRAASPAHALWPGLEVDPVSAHAERQPAGRVDKTSPKTT